jgi:hypothetical protein
VLIDELSDVPAAGIHTATCRSHLVERAAHQLGAKTLAP